MGPFTSRPRIGSDEGAERASRLSARLATVCNEELKGLLAVDALAIAMQALGSLLLTHLVENIAATRTPTAVEVIEYFQRYPWQRAAEIVIEQRTKRTGGGLS